MREKISKTRKEILNTKEKIWTKEMIKSEFVQPLLEWYRKEKRTLPWRDQQNAYYTWVSEIMLQQTRVEAVKPYFARFIGELPDVKALAYCPEEKLMKLWEGLGYYNRVRNMQKAALQVMESYEGVIPASYEELLKLSGIGNYTAGAIASIAYGIPVPAVDGNVLRVISRLTENDGDIMKQSVRREVEEGLLKIIPSDCPGDFNQAMMEIGAVICVPNGAPKCEECPIASECMAYQHDAIANYPVKTKKKDRVIEERTVFLIQDGSLSALKKRPKKGLLAGLYELPNVPGHLSDEEAVRYVESLNLEALHIEELGAAKHIFSHIEWRMIGYRIRVSSLTEPDVPELLFVDRKKTAEELAIPSAFRAYTKYMNQK